MIYFVYCSNLTSDTKIVHCPFNTAHIMPNKTLMLHLVKCPDRLPNFKSCSFNYAHIMPQNEIEVKK